MANEIAVTVADVRHLDSDRYPVVRMYAAGAIDLGDAVYVTATADTVDRTDGDALATAWNFLGIVVSCPQGATAAVAGDNIDVAIGGRVTGYTGMTAGTVIVLSGTVGRLTAHANAPAKVAIVGIALNATTIQLRPIPVTLS
jgi:hypothetical protein